MLGMEGVMVTEAEREAGGRLPVWAKVTAPASCPGCGTVSHKVHQYVVTAPRDVRICGEEADFFLVRRRMECPVPGCPTGTFTEWVPQLPPRCSITRRLLAHAGAEVTERGITPAEAARHNRISWPSAHGAFTEKADKILGDEIAPVACLGIDEHRRGRPRWRRDTDSGEYVQLADRWHTCFYDLSGSQGMLGQVEGRTADDAAYWLAGATQDWRDAVEIVAIDMCTIYLSAVKRMLPHAKVAVDLFHVVQLAVKAVGDVRRRAIREKYGRRGKAGDPEYGIKHLLERKPGEPVPGRFREDNRRPRRQRGGATGRPGLDREGKTPQRPQAPRPRHRQHAMRAAGPRQAVRLLRLVRTARGHPRTGHPREDHRPLGKRDRHRRDHRCHQRVGFILRLSLVLMRCSCVMAWFLVPGVALSCCW